MDSGQYDLNNNPALENQLEQASEDQVKCLVPDSENDTDSPSSIEHDELYEYCSRPTDPYKKNVDYSKEFHTPNTKFVIKGIQEERAAEINTINIEVEQFIQESYDNINWFKPVLLNVVRDCPRCQEELSHYYYEQTKLLLMIQCATCKFIKYGVLEHASPATFDHQLHAFIGMSAEDEKDPKICWVVCHCCSLYIDEKFYAAHLNHACCGEFQPRPCELCRVAINSLEELRKHSYEKHGKLFTFEEIGSLLRLENDKPCRSANGF